MTGGPEFDSFYRETHPRLWAYLARTTRDPSLAEEITQESFVRLLASRGADLPEQQRRAYLFRIAENLTRDLARRRVRERTTSLEEVAEAVSPGPPEPMSRRALTALGALGERERKMLWLAHVEGWSHAEIASLLGLAAGSIRVMLHRARRRFQDHLEQEESR